MQQEAGWLYFATSAENNQTVYIVARIARGSAAHNKQDRGIRIVKADGAAGGIKIMDSNELADMDMLGAGARLSTGQSNVNSGPLSEVVQRSSVGLWPRNRQRRRRVRRGAGD